jgi:phage replication O-like protein O
MKNPNPQLEDGYIRIAMEIWEALTAYRVPGEQEQCLKFVIRKTYGWGKKEDGIALSQFVKATGLKKQHAYRALKALIEKNIIVTKKGDKGYVIYGFNKNYKKWKRSPKKVTVTKKGYRGSPKKVTRPYPKMVNTIDNYTIDTITIDKLHHRNGISKKAKAVLRYLNKIKGSRYTDTTPVEARLNAGGTIKECIQIINNKAVDDHFIDNPKFLCPATLFRKSHWDKYLNDIPKKPSKFSKKMQKNIEVLKEWGDSDGK